MESESRSQQPPQPIKKELITNPIARFNLNLDGQNPDQQPTVESGVPQVSEHTASDQSANEEQLKKDERLKNELSEPVRLKDPYSNQRLNALQLNWDRMTSKSSEPSKPVLVFLPPFNNKIEEGATHYRIEELARQTDRPTLAFDHPGMGHSDGLTEAQKRGFKTGREYRGVAETQLRIMKELGITDVDLTGQSMGAWAMAQIAEVAAEQHDKYGITVHNLVMVETPGVEDFSLVGIGQRFGREGKYLDLYTENPHDPKQLESSGGPLKILQMLKIGLDSVKSDPLRYTRAMRKNTMPATLKKALLLNPELKLTNIHGTISGISTAKGNRDMMENVQESVGEDGAHRVREIIFPGEPHTVMESAKRYGAMVKRAIS